METDMRNGRLDGISIIRFTHAFAGGGGIEKYMDDLDRTLLQKNRAAILQIRLTDNPHEAKVSNEFIGQGSLTKVYLDAIVNKNMKATEIHGVHRFDRVKDIMRDWILYNPLLYKTAFKFIIGKRRPARGLVEAKDARKEIKKIFGKKKFDLLILHHIGSIDTEDIIDEVKKMKLPYVFVNHFSNDRLNHISARKQLADASGVAGVTAIGVPDWLKRIFVNLGDGIDTEYFKPTSAGIETMESDPHIVLYPARIVRSKGQMDLLETCSLLRKTGVSIKVVFAGRSDSKEYEKELKTQVKALNIQENVLFLGEISRDKLRDWYGAASIVAFPTYFEGLSRVVIEAQAMKVPTVAYNVGGMSEAMKDGITGILVKRGNLKELSNSIEGILKNNELRRKMGEEGRKYVEQYFSLKALAERHEKFYARAISNV